jgi:predicted dinucleotide-binding enzyme
MSNIVIIGAGNVGGPLASTSERYGHRVTTVTSSSDVDASAAALSEADIVVLATPFDVALALPEAWRQAVAGKVVVDATNPLTADFSELTVGFDSSGAEEIAARIPQARVVKALNAVLAPNHDPSALEGASLFVPIAGDDQEAVDATVGYLTTLGFDAVPTGPLKNARYIEPLAELLVQLAYFRGAGTAIGVALHRA